MKTIKNTTTEALKELATKVGGKLWEKNEMRRIYVNGGNNYHYNGKWWYEIAADGSWESKVYLTEGYDNRNREEYTRKQLRDMDDAMESALGESPEFDMVIVDENKTIKQNTFMGTAANFGEGTDYPANFYNGCGSYYLAIKYGRVVASVNFTSTMGRRSSDELAYFSQQLAERGLTDCEIMEADGSGVTFFARQESAGQGIEKKVYHVPGPGGRRHKNIELVLV